MAPVMSLDLATFITALCQPSVQVESLARDSDAGDPGWSIILDLDRCPLEGLPWLGQLNGTIVDTTLSEADQRLQILNAGGQKRGRPATIAAAIAPYLTGTKTIFFKERDPAASPALPAYGLTVTTYNDETPDPVLVGNILHSPLVKPAGIVLVYNHINRGTYASLLAGEATYAHVLVDYPTYHDVLGA